MSKKRLTRSTRRRELARVRFNFLEAHREVSDASLEDLVDELLMWDEQIQAEGVAIDNGSETVPAVTAPPPKDADIDDMAPLVMLLLTRQIDAGRPLNQRALKWISRAFTHALRGNPLNASLPCSWDPIEGGTELDARDYFICQRVLELHRTKGMPLQAAKDFVANEYGFESGKSVEAAYLAWRHVFDS